MLGIGCTLLMAGNFPGVLFRVTLAWILGVDFSTCLEVEDFVRALFVARQ